MAKKKEEMYRLSDSSIAMDRAGYTSKEILTIDHHKMIKFAEEYAKIMFADNGEELEIVRKK